MISETLAAWLCIAFFNFMIVSIIATLMLVLWIKIEKKRIRENACEHEWITIPIEIEGTFHPTIFTLIFGGVYHGKIKVEVPKCRKCNKQIEPDTWR